MDEQVRNALRLMCEALLLLDECQEYVAATHLQQAIDALVHRPADDQVGRHRIYAAASAIAIPSEKPMQQD